MFERTREVPAGWQEALEQIVPKTDRAPWLKIAWMAGKSYEPVQRWVIYEMQPEATLTDPQRGGLIYHGLQGPRPDTFGHWTDDSAVDGGKRWVSHSTVSQLQWDLYHEYRCLPTLFWIIQGSGGGHRWVLSEIEQRFVRAMRGDNGGPDLMLPRPGELEYAPYDKRVEAHILKYDRLRSWEHAMMAPWENRLTQTQGGLYINREDAALEENYAQTMQAFLKDQIESAISDLTRREASMIADMATPAQDGYMRDADEVSEKMIREAVTTTL